MTGAEKLAKKKKRQRAKRNGKAKSERVLWTCKLAEVREAHNLAMRDVAHAVGLSEPVE